jgi:molybdopterin molybdotransferase
MKGKMLLLENAQEILDQELQKLSLLPPKIELVPLWEAGGRVIAKDVVAEEDVPAFDRSPVDGFALLASDTLTAADDHPVTLEVTDTIAAGSSGLRVLTPGTAMKIFTGAPLPQGANSVIKKEDVSETQLGNTVAVTIKRPVAEGEGIAFKGEDISFGESLLSKGTILTPAHMGILSTLGIDPVPVYEKPQIGIFSTGNELVNTHDQLQHGQLRASNIYTLAGIIRLAGGIPVSFGIVKDRVENVIQVYRKVQHLNLPMVISTGGTASGDYDFVKEAMDKASSLRLFDKVAIRPGAPLVASVKAGQLLFGLSGNPSGAVVAMLLLIFPLISKLAGTKKQLAQSRGKLLTPLIRKGGMRGFLWSSYYEQNGSSYVAPFENQFCGAIKTYANSNCLIEIPAGEVNLAVDDLVTIWKLP